MKSSRLVTIIVGFIAVIGLVAGAVYIFVLRDNDTLDIGAVNRPADQRLLFIGNSFTQYHDLYNMVDLMLEESSEAWDDVLTGQQAPGGASFVDHLAEIENEEDNPALRQALITGNETLRDWDAVVLQEQSQVLGFGAGNVEYAESVAAAQAIHRIIIDTGGMTLLYMTWGYRDGDQSNSQIYPDYPTMQERITNGYDDLATVLQGLGGRVTVIPVGLAFQVVYNDEVAAGHNPLGEDSQFYALYEGDGSHPSEEGSYLAACVFMAAYTGQPASSLSYRADGVDEDTADYLRGVADRVVLENVMGDRVYPFEE
jgi:hypothetical protein